MLEDVALIILVASFGVVAILALKKRSGNDGNISGN